MTKMKKFIYSVLLILLIASCNNTPAPVTTAELKSTENETISCLQAQVEFKTQTVKSYVALIKDLIVIINSTQPDSVKVQQLQDETGGIVWGCTNPNCSNYDRNANHDDSSCIYTCYE